jgi:glycogen/starch/alpha-glucan phosphorylase-like protein
MQESLEKACESALRFAVGKEPQHAAEYDKYQSLAIAVRTRLMDKWLQTEARYRETGAKKVYYLSLEFLMGRTLQNAIVNLDIEHEAREAIRKLGMVLEDAYEQEYDAGLGNGGLGRLAACFLDSMATLNLPAKGYGIRYEYGIFNQMIENGYQIEQPDYWLYRGNPWETPRIDSMQTVQFYGRTHHQVDHTGKLRVEWVDTDNVQAVPYETPIPGYRTDTVNLLTLWSPGRPMSSTWRVLTMATACAPWSRKRGARRFQKCSIPMTRLSRARSCASSRNIFLFRPHCRKSFGIFCSELRISCDYPIRRPSSSTTPIPALPLRN